MPTTFNVISLGALAGIDTLEGNSDAENAAALNGLSFGTIANPLASNPSDFDVFTPVSTTGGNYLQDNNTSSDSFSINGGPPQTFDAISTYNATITYVDGTTSAITAVIIQDTAGNSYLLPELATGADQAVLEQMAIRSLTLDSVERNTSIFMGGTRESWDTSNICLALGSLIKTIDGEQLIENLKVGDLVLTQDMGYQPIRWIGSNTVSAYELKQNPYLSPVRISKGAMGAGMPSSDLLVSRQHRMLVRSAISERIFHEQEVLVPAIKLCALEGIEIAKDVEDVTYFHILFDEHQVIWSNGAATESLFTGPEAMSALSPESRAEIIALFPKIVAPDFHAKTARTLSDTGKMLRDLVARHVKNNKPLVSTQ